MGALPGHRSISALILATAIRTKAQTGTSTIRGEISDAQGKVIGGATVTLKNPSVGFSRTQTTGAAGGYSFELISPGDYVLEVEAKGFKKVVRNVTALVGSVSTADLQLEVGSMNEVVQVEAGAAVVAINTEDATLGNTFENDQIVKLPLKDRDILGLLTLQPGVTYAIDPNSTTSGSVNGARADQSNLTLDGVDINETETGRISTPVLPLNSEATEEFRLTTLNAPASQGRSSAAQVNLVTKSGTNSFHGAGFESYRGPGWTSNNFFNNRTINPTTGQPLPKPARGTRVPSGHGGARCATSQHGSRAIALHRHQRKRPDAHDGAAQSGLFCRCGQFCGSRGIRERGTKVCGE